MELPVAPTGCLWISQFVQVVIAQFLKKVIVRRVLFTSAIDAINTLSAAQAGQRLKAELKKYISPSVLIRDRPFLMRESIAVPETLRTYP